jgi:hypothetical protein
VRKLLDELNKIIKKIFRRTCPEKKKGGEKKKSFTEEKSKAEQTLDQLHCIFILIFLSEIEHRLHISNLQNIIKKNKRRRKFF